MGVGSFGFSCLSTRSFYCIRQSESMNKKPWSRNWEEAQGQHKSFGKNRSAKQPFFPQGHWERLRGAFWHRKSHHFCLFWGGRDGAGFNLVHHIAAMQIAAMHNADFLQRKRFPLFYSIIAVMARPVLQHRHVNFLTSSAWPFGLCFHFSFRHNGFLYKTARISPRVTMQQCRHWQRGMVIANANAAMRCTKSLKLLKVYVFFFFFRAPELTSLS